MKRRFIILAALALLLGSCMSEENRIERANKELGSKKNPIKMYYVPSQEAQKVIKSADAIADFLHQETGYYFKSAVPTSYAAVIEAIGSYQADVAWLPPVAYVLAKDKYNVNLQFMTSRNGLHKYCGQFTVRADSGIDDLEDLSGKVVAYTDYSSASGYVYPAEMLRAKHIQTKKPLITGGHTSAILAVYAGNADAACTYWSPPDSKGVPQDARKSLLETYPDVFQKIKIIALTDSIPNDTVTFRKDLPKDLEQKLFQGFVKLSQSKEGQDILRSLYSVDNLVIATDHDYDIVRSKLKSLDQAAQELLK